MNLEAVLLTALIGAVLFGSCVAVASQLTWTIRYRSRMFRAIRKRSDPTEYRDDHIDD